MASHSSDLRRYICTKNQWISQVFESMDWQDFHLYMESLDKVRQTNVIKLEHNWIHDGHQKDIFSKIIETITCPAKCEA